ADRHALPLAARQLADRRIGIDADTAEADGVEQDAVGDLLLLPDLDEAQAVGDLAAGEEVAPQWLLLAQRLLLVDRLDAQLVGAAHRIFRPRDQLVTDIELPGGRPLHPGDDLDQGRL